MDDARGRREADFPAYLPPVSSAPSPHTVLLSPRTSTPTLDPLVRTAQVAVASSGTC